MDSQQTPPPKKGAVDPAPHHAKAPFPAAASIAVIVPTYNAIAIRGEAVLLATLESIERSVAYFQQHAGDRARCEVVLVDDASQDGTLSVLQEFARPKSHIWIARQPENRGQSAARNAGIRLVQSSLICFCDSDDLFRETYILKVFEAANQPLPPTHPQYPALGYPAIVRTRVHLRDRIHPQWKRAIENTLCQNLCIRRELHDFIGGFPEAEIFRQGQEDIAYLHLYSAFAPTVWVEAETVEYLRFPGNNFDRQLRKFQTSPDEYRDDSPPAERARMAAIGNYVKQKLDILQKQVPDFKPNNLQTT